MNIDGTTHTASARVCVGRGVSATACIPARNVIIHRAAQPTTQRTGTKSSSWIKAVLGCRNCAWEGRNAPHAHRHLVCRPRRTHAPSDSSSATHPRNSKEICHGTNHTVCPTPHTEEVGGGGKEGETPSTTTTVRMATNKSCCVPHTTQPTTRRCARTNPIEAIMPTPYGHLTPPNPTHHNYKAKALSGGSDDASSSTVHAQRRDQLPGSVVRQEGRRGCSRLAVISSLLCTLSRLHSSFCTHTSITLVQSVACCAASCPEEGTAGSVAAIVRCACAYSTACGVSDLAVPAVEGLGAAAAV